MAENKTKPTAISVDAFIDSVADPVRQADARVLAAMFAQISGAPAKLWGPSIIGFGSYHYRYDSGREGNASRIAFSPRKPEQVLYVGASDPRNTEWLAKLGKHRIGKTCLYIKRLADVDMSVLDEIVSASFAASLAEYPDG